MEKMESRGFIFNGTKYTLMASYALNIIVFIIYVIMGTFMTASAHVDTSAELEKEITHEDKKALKMSGYTLVTVAMIGIGISWAGLYAVYREIYKLNLYLSIVAVLGLILTLITQPNPIPVVIHCILTAASIFFTMKLKQFRDFPSMNDTEMGKNRPNENSAIMMNSN